MEAVKTYGDLYRYFVECKKAKETIEHIPDSPIKQQLVDIVQNELESLKLRFGEDKIKYVCDLAKTAMEYSTVIGDLRWSIHLMPNGERGEYIENLKKFTELVEQFNKEVENGKDGSRV